ncbi:MAG TPA: hypothetical protein VJL60_00580 [Gammaproteobacteria bacterium]|nr:hypothetical protein [Gammaproteobacteria bacterium]
MSDWKMYRLTSDDANRIEEITERVNKQGAQQNMRSVSPAIVLRALILNGQQTETDKLIEAVKQAKIYV